MKVINKIFSKVKESKKDIISFVLICAISFSMAMVLKQKVVILAKIPSESMESTINVGDLVLGHRLAYNNSKPKRGEIAIFYAPDKVDTLYIKRIIGLPGDKVVIDDGKIYINDSKTPLEEDYLEGDWTVLNGYMEYEVPEGSYFMLGDNRDRSCDSREWVNTYVTEDKIVARAECIYFPFSDLGSLKE